MEILLTVARRMARSLAVCTLMVGITLVANGEAALIPAFLMGYLVSAVCIWTMGSRIWRSAGLSVKSAKRQMLWGLFLRLAMLFAVLLAAVQISVRIFGMVAAGFLLFYVLAMVHLMMANISERRH